MADNFYGVTDAGKMRENNEDNFIAQTILNGKYIVGCVIDGVGGYEGGEVASALARTSILNTLKKTSGDIIETLKQAVTTANQKIFEEKHSTGKNMQMACVVTLALADINNNKFYYAHVGDTRLYLFRDDSSLVKVSHDHSFVGFLEDSGRLTEEAAMQHPKRNEINKALGFDEEKFSEPDYIETGESPFLPGDMLLICSDGLTDMIDNRTIAGILNSPKNIKDKANALVDAANLAGGKDNITVVMVKNNKSPLQHEAIKPVVVKKNEPEKQEIIITDNTPAKPVAEPVKRKGSSFLGIICILLLAALAWFVYNDYFKNNKAIISDEPLPVLKNTLEQRLQDNINHTTAKELSLKEILGQAQTVSVNDSLVITKDSLHIKGNGITLIADSLYKGAGLIFSPSCKYILLDSITLENFNIAALVYNKSLHLNNVQFKNCQYPVAMAIPFQSNQTVSGDISDSMTLRVDSAKTRIIKK